MPVEASAPIAEVPITPRELSYFTSSSNAQHQSLKTFLKLFAFLYFNFIVSASRLRNRQGLGSQTEGQDAAFLSDLWVSGVPSKQ